MCSCIYTHLATGGALVGWCPCQCHVTPTTVVWTNHANALVAQVKCDQPLPPDPAREIFDRIMER